MFAANPPDPSEEFVTVIESVTVPLRHTVMIIFQEAAPQSVIDSTVVRLRQLASLDGVISLEIHRSLDQRKGNAWIEVVEFTDGPAFLKWRASSLHTALTDELKDVADWYTADYILGT